MAKRASKKKSAQKDTQQLAGSVLDAVAPDAVWYFCYAKDKNVPDDMRGDPGIG